MSADEYTPIRVATLRGDAKIPFDVYVRVAGKYIHYCRAGDSFEGVRLDRLRAKKLRKMYIKPEDDIPYQQYLEQNIDSAYDSKSNRNDDSRAEIIQGFQQAAAEQYMEEPQYEFSYNHMRSSVQRLVEHIQKDARAGYRLLKLKNTDQSVAHHCVNVATLAVLLALDSKFKESAKIPLLATGCMIHDFDHYNRDMTVLKRPAEMTPEELAYYKEHPLRGAQQLQTTPFIDQLVLNVILQHEENAVGTGFPKGLTEKEMDPLVMMAITANAYDRLTSFEAREPKDAMKHLTLEGLGLYPLNLIQSLQKIVKAG